MHYFRLYTLLFLAATTAVSPAQVRLTLSPLPKPVASASEAQTSLGRLLFFDPRLSGDATISCATCHDPEHGWSDGLALSDGYPGSKYFRNTPTVINASLGRSLYWDGRLPATDLPTIVRDHICEAHFMQVDGRLIIERMRQVPEYESSFRSAFGGEPTYGRILAAIAAFVSSLRSADVPFDAYLQGDPSAISASAKRGLALFQEKAGCVRCHHGPMLSDGRFHSLGLPPHPDIFLDPERHITFRRFLRTLGVPDCEHLRKDPGLFGVTKKKTDMELIRTPTLREVSQTAPYMHDGQLATLEDVVRFYNEGGGPEPSKDSLLKPLNLTAEEQSDLVAFLRTLSGTPPNPMPPDLPEYELKKLNPVTHIDRPLSTPASKTAAEFPPLAPLPQVPVPLDNPITDARVRLGKLLFFDGRLSGDLGTSCASCHEPDLGWGDGQAVSLGYTGTQHWRNSQTTINSAFYTKLFWAGESPSLEAQAHSAITGNLAGNGDPVMTEERLLQIPAYVELFKQAFGTDRPTFPHVVKAIATFERAAMTSRDSPFDRYLAGDQDALSEEAIRGLTLFNGKAGCIQCHNGALISDEDYHYLDLPRHEVFETDPLRQIALRYQHYIRGVPENVYRSASRDLGLYYTTKKESDKGRFRTPSLRYIAYTAPYMHNGVLTTIEDVIEYYNAGGGSDPNQSPLIRPLNLTQNEKSSLAAFLRSLSGTEIRMRAPQLPDYEITEDPATAANERAATSGKGTP